MSSGPPPSALTPPRDDAIPESYAIHVSDSQLRVWQFRVTLAEPDGGWTFVESQAHEKDPRLSLEYATLSAPADEGYWVYSRTYDCTLDCE